MSPAKMAGLGGLGVVCVCVCVCVGGGGGGLSEVLSACWIHGLV